MNSEHTNAKQLDSYSLLICSKYLKNEQDFINLICVNSKLKETTEKLHYNPIPVTSMKLFPKMQTQYLYSRSDTILKGVDRYEIWFIVNYNEYLEYKKKNSKCHHVKYTSNNRTLYGQIPYTSNNTTLHCEIPYPISILSEELFKSYSLTSITIPTTVTEIENNCFERCGHLQKIILSKNLTRISNGCFSSCTSLTSITIPSSIHSIGNNGFYNCVNLKLIDIANSVTSIGSGCFKNNNQLVEITLPTSLTALQTECFYDCLSLNKVILPTTLKTINDECFYYCKSLTSITLPPSLEKIGNKCFHNAKFDQLIFQV